MSLDTYANLKTAIGQRMGRSDKAAFLADFIDIAHAKMMRGQKTPDGRGWIVPPLRFDPMLDDEDLTPAAGAATLPADYLQAKRIVTDTSGARPLEYMPPEQFRANTLFVASGVPRFYTIEGRQLLIMPSNTGVLSVLYYFKPTALSDSVTTNEILDNLPQAYFYGALAEAFAQVRNTDQAAYYTAQFAGAVFGANEADELGQVAGGQMVMRVGSVP